MVLIRAYRPADRAAVRKIYQETAFHGRPYHHFFDDGEWLADIMTLIYTDFEPEASFVAEEGGQVIGYLIGTTDTRRYRSLWKKKALPKVVGEFFKKGLWYNRRALNFFYNGIRSLFRREEITPRGLEEDYPAHFHINLAEGRRGGGTGTQLTAAFFEHLRTKGVTGVHVRTASLEPKQRFFESLGFRPLLIRRLTLWDYLQQPPYHLITYGLSLKK